MCIIALKQIKFCISFPILPYSFHQASACFTCSDHFLPQIYEYVSVSECHAQMLLQLSECHAQMLLQLQLNLFFCCFLVNFCSQLLKIKRVIFTQQFDFIRNQRNDLCCLEKSSNFKRMFTKYCEITILPREIGLKLDFCSDLQMKMRNL